MKEIKVGFRKEKKKELDKELIKTCSNCSKLSGLCPREAKANNKKYIPKRFKCFECYKLNTSIS